MELQWTKYFGDILIEEFNLVSTSDKYIYFSSFEAGNCVYNFTLQWMTNKMDNGGRVVIDTCTIIIAHSFIQTLKYAGVSIRNSHHTMGVKKHSA